MRNKKKRHPRNDLTSDESAPVAEMSLNPSSTIRLSAARKWTWVFSGGAFTVCPAFPQERPCGESASKIWKVGR